jgi:hypothetical protein
MQGTMQGRTGMTVVMEGGTGTFEAADGETYTIYVRYPGDRPRVIHDVWNDQAQDWTGNTLCLPWKAFARRHGITALVS